MMGHLIIYWRYVRNGGASLILRLLRQRTKAFREGLERAKGEYVYFMDPDDYINPGMFGEVMKKCHEGNYDAVHFGFQTIYEDQGNIHYDKFEKPHVYVSNQEIPSQVYWFWARSYQPLEGWRYLVEE